MAGQAANAAKMGQWLTDRAAQKALENLVAETRPWVDEVDVGRRLSTWVGRSLDPLGCADVAGELARLGKNATNLPDDPTMAAIAFHMLVNVARGRGPTEADVLGDHTVGVVSERTARRYRSDAGRDAITGAVERLQRELDTDGLRRKGLSYSTARKRVYRGLRNSPLGNAPDRGDGR